MSEVATSSGGGTSNRDWLVSVDDHLLEPSHLWQQRLPRKYLDEGPRIVNDNAGEYWVYEDLRKPTLVLEAAAGKKREEFSATPVSYRDMRPGCYDSVARLDDMDRAGILASLCFPSFPRF